MEIKELEQLIGILKNSDVREFDFQKEGVHVKISRGIVAEAAPVIHYAAGPVQPAIVGAHAGPPPAAGNGHAEIADHLVKVESPIIGTFYRKPAPDQEPFVQQGDVVKKGETLCIVEAMKLMNEIEAPCSGKIEKIMLSDGQVVEFGEILFLINPQI